MGHPAVIINLLLAAWLRVTYAKETSKSLPSGTGNSSKFDHLPSHGTGPKYASACSSANIAYTSATNSWISRYQYVKTTDEVLGGTTISEVTYYENATTLCDGHARVTYSPAIPLSSKILTDVEPVTGTTTILGTYFPNIPFSAPTCSIKPSDCGPLWTQYSSDISAAARITPPPSIPTPPCVNESAAAVYSSATAQIYGCGPCTIFGNGVQLVYFPTSVSRNFCASTPTATLTHYGPNAVITAFAGKNATVKGNPEGRETAVANGHTFTSGTAYISIATVSAVDRCSKTFGTPVRDAILAMHSESVLSLRYSQDHFQVLMETDKITGYPVSYADFNTPIPWSAWNGQNICDPGGYGGWDCSIIYEGSFRPQLAIPPQITDLSPHFKGCQMWYNGLYDPPLALQPAQTVAEPTLPHKIASTSTATPAIPSFTRSPPVASHTALADEVASSNEKVIASSAAPVRTASAVNDDHCDSNPERCNDGGDTITMTHATVNPGVDSGNDRTEVSIVSNEHALSSATASLVGFGAAGSSATRSEKAETNTGGSQDHSTSAAMHEATSGSITKSPHHATNTPADNGNVSTSTTQSISSSLAFSLIAVVVALFVLAAT